MTLFYIAMGGAIGASLRYLTTTMVARHLGHGFPFGTLTVNIVGSFIMGFCAIYLIERFGGMPHRFAPFLMTGVLGGYTTFSAFSLDALTLLDRGRGMAALIYMGGSVILAVGALWVGIMLARLIWS